MKALSDVNLSVDLGALVAVMGPNGSGQVTLLTIAGSLRTGWRRGEQRPAHRMSHNEKARLRRRAIGFVFQDFNLMPGLTAAENVSLRLELDGLWARRPGRAEDAPRRLGLADRADHFPDELSGGRAPRVAIARAVVRAPPAACR